MATGSALRTCSSLAKTVSRSRRLHRRDAHAARGGDRGERAVHNGGVRAVAGEGEDARLRAGRDEQVVIGQVVVLVAVVQLHRADGGGHDGGDQLRAEEVERAVGGAVFADRVHVQAELLPLLIVADKARAEALRAGAGDGIAAAQTVADGTCLAVGAHAGARLCQNLIVIHKNPPLRNDKKCDVFSLHAGGCPRKIWVRTRI